MRAPRFIVRAVLLAGFVSLSGMGAALSGAPPTMVRGPYLQLPTPTTAVVRWRTLEAVSSRLEYGPDLAAASTITEDPTPRFEHEVALADLDPATRYEYTVGSSEGVLPVSAERFFVTPPPLGSRGPTRIWVTGDSGTANANARAVRDAYLQLAAERRADLWLMLGDNAYNSGTEAEYQAAVFETYPGLLETTWLWPAMGNHDAFTSVSATESGPFFDLFTLPAAAEAGGLPSGTEAYYSFDHAGIHFVCLDTADSSLLAGSPMLTWLAADLAATNRDWVIVFGHHPPYTKGTHDSDNAADSGGRLFAVRENVLPILETGGVDLVLAGHSHVYERSFLLDGHHGLSHTLAGSMILDGGDGRPAGDGAYRKSAGAHQGAVYVVVGSSGRVGPGSLDHPAMLVALSRLGSLVLDVEGPRLRGRFVDSDGLVADDFTIIKGVEGLIFFDDFESGSVEIWGSTSRQHMIPGH